MVDNWWIIFVLSRKLIEVEQDIKNLCHENLQRKAIFLDQFLLTPDFVHNGLKTLGMTIIQIV